MMIFKVFLPSEWAEFQSNGTTQGAAVDRADGYIHFSTAAQLPVTLSKHFASAGDLMLLACDATTLGTALQWETSRGGDFFPHLYRELTLEDLRWWRPLLRNQDGHQTGSLE